MQRFKRLLASQKIFLRVLILSNMLVACEYNLEREIARSGNGFEVGGGGGGGPPPGLTNPNCVLTPYDASFTGASVTAEKKVLAVKFKTRIQSNLRLLLKDSLMEISGNYSSSEKLRDDGRKVLDDIFGIRKTTLVSENFENFYKQLGAPSIQCALLPIKKMQRGANPSAQDLTFEPGLPYFISPVEKIEVLQKELDKELIFDNLRVKVGAQETSQKVHVKISPRSTEDGQFAVDVETLVEGSASKTKDLGLLPRITYLFKSGFLSGLLVPTSGLTDDVSVSPSVIPYNKKP